MTWCDDFPGGTGTCTVAYVGDCALGVALMAASDRGVKAVAFADTLDDALGHVMTEWPGAAPAGGPAVAAGWWAALLRQIASPEPSFTLPLDVAGTTFQREVWAALAAIPMGETRTYWQLAQSMSRPKAVRAVANACAANPTAVVVPCHRVIGSEGQMRGFRWGVERKRRLLAAEAAVATRRAVGLCG